jgi:molybdate transport system substrate-binding protein
MRILAALLACLAFAGAALADVTVFAAASLKESLDDVARSFQASTGIRTVISYAGSNALAKQVGNGAPAGVFISADTDWIDYVEKRGAVVPGSRADLLANDLVLVAPRSSSAQVTLARGVNLAAILGDKRIALANADAVPAGRYAKAALTALGAWDAIAGKVAATDNVRAALALVARGEAPLGAVYRTDALAEKNVKIVATFPADTHPAIVYPVVRLKAAANADEAMKFVRYLRTQAALEVFRKHGFRAP